MESILVSIKKMLGIGEDYNAFDAELTVIINSGLMVLNQVGVGTEGFSITGDSETWNDFLGERHAKLFGAKDWMYCFVRIQFDPPSSSFLLGALKDMKDELESRLKTQSEVLQ